MKKHKIRYIHRKIGNCDSVWLVPLPRADPIIPDNDWCAAPYTPLDGTILAIVRAVETLLITCKTYR